MSGLNGKSIVDFFCGELKSNVSQRRCEAARRLCLTAGAVGPELTRTRLVPLINETVNAEGGDDEFLHALADSLKGLTKYLEGEQHWTPLFRPLSALAAQGETVIREAAVTSIASILREASEKWKLKYGEDTLFDIVQSLAAAEKFAPRVSACQLLPVVYPFVTENQKSELRKLFAKLCSDETPMVRRAIAAKLADLCECLEAASFHKDIMPSMKALAEDETQDGIRISCLQAAPKGAELLKQQSVEVRNQLKQFVRAATEDRSWRVRLSLAKQLLEICVMFGPDEMSTAFMPLSLALLHDFEAEVRAAAIQGLAVCLEQRIIPASSIRDHIMPEVATLAADAACNVRAALASAISYIAERVGSNASQKVLVTVVLDLMRDEFRDVRLNIVKHAGDICRVCGLDNVEHPLLNMIRDLMGDAQWRVRLSVVSLLPSLANQFGTEMFQQRLESLLTKGLDDSVYAVREAAVRNLGGVARIFGPSWTVSSLIPKVHDHFKRSTNYVHRMAALHALPEIAQAIEAPQVEEHILPILKKAFEDPVANVRLSAARTCKILLANCTLTSSVVSTYMEQPLQSLTNESDADVKFFAQQALQSCAGRHGR